MTIYYVDFTGGLDGNAGTSELAPWKTLGKVNTESAAFNAGDIVLFKRGETWPGRLWPTSSGSPGNHIIFRTYGLGAKPIFSSAGQNDSILVSDDDYLTFQDLVGTLADGGGAGYGVRLTNACDNIHLIRIDVMDANAEGIFIEGCTNVTVENCTSTGCRVGLQFWGASHDCAVIGGSYYSNDEEGFDIENGSYNIVATGVTCHSNTLAGFDSDDNAYNSTYRRCTAHSNGTNGFTIANDGDGFRYESCISYGNGENGFELQTGTGDGVVIVHCTAANNDARNYRLDDGDNHIFENNIGKYAGWGSQLRIAVAVLATITLDYNCYYQTNSCMNMVDANEYNTLGAWQTATGQEAHSLFADPLFLAEYTNLRLQSISPCRDAGVDVGLDQDYAGNKVPRGSAPDMGAYEFFRGVLGLTMLRAISPIYQIGWHGWRGRF